jgi:transcriptional regulator with XRE-family HTH domain
VEIEVAETIRRLRAVRGWSVRQAADRAGIGRSTLSRWERGEAHPSRPELERYYAVFGLNLPSPAPLADRALPVSRADLLRALRGRTGLSLEGAAELFGVSKPVLSRYESGARTPVPEAAERFAHLLGASEREAAAAREGEVRLPFTLGSVADAEAQVARLADQAETGGRELDLPVLALDGWLRQAGAEEVRLALAGVYVRWLGWWYRDREADRWGRRDLDLMVRYPHSPAWSRIWRARAVYVSEIERQPRAAEAILRQAANAVRGFGSEGQICREWAGALGSLGAHHEALAVLDRARAAAVDDESEARHAFCCDAVEAGLWAARGDYARAWRLAYDRLPSEGFLRFALAGGRAEALVQLGEAERAVSELHSLALNAHTAGLPHFAKGMERRSARIEKMLL